MLTIIADRPQPSNGYRTSAGPLGCRRLLFLLEAPFPRAQSGRRRAAGVGVELIQEVNRDPVLLLLLVECGLNAVARRNRIRRSDCGFSRPSISKPRSEW